MDDRVLVAEMVAYIEQHLVDPVRADDLAVRSGYSLNRLREKFFNVTGDTPSGYLRKRRLTEAAKEILAGARPVEAALKYGYSTQENFITAFRSFFGVTPAEIAKIEGKYKRFIRTMREAYTIMEITGLKQPPLSTTLMGCVKGVSDYFDGDLTVPMLFGLTGHAFLINVAKDLCPSSPYVWNKSRFWELLAGIGVRTVAEYGVTRTTTEADRRGIEERLKKHLNDGELCILDFLEHQLLGGYDEKGFLMLKPWGMAPSEVAQITYGSWVPCLEKEGWAHLTVVARNPVEKTVAQAAKDALSHALELRSRPESFEEKGYGIGPRAYRNWIACLERGMGNTHGNWWNGMVWSECRGQAAAFFRELAELTEDAKAVRLCGELEKLYGGVASALAQVKDKERPQAEQLALLHQASDAEDRASALLEELGTVL